MRNLFYAILFTLPLTTTAQDTLIAEIRIVNTPNGVEVIYSKDLRYTDEDIATFLLQVFTPEATKPKESTHEKKIKKI